MRVLPFLGVSLAVIALLLTSVRVLAAGSDFRFNNWNIEQGLPQSTAVDMVQDPSGFVWIATLGGLARFDGTDFKHFTASDGSIVDNYLTSLAIDHQGWLWVGSQRGLTRLNSFSYEHQHFLSDEVNDNSLTHNRINDIYVDKKGDVWVATLSGVNRFDRTTRQFQRLKPATDLQVSNPLSFVGIAADSENQLWTLANNGQLFRLEQGQLASSNQKVPYKADVLAIDKDDRLWVGGSGTSVYVLDLETGQEQSITLLGQGDVRDMAPDDSGSMWIATLSGGVQIVSSQLEVSLVDGQETFHTKSLLNDSFRSVMFDREGYVWLGGVEFGLFRQNKVASEIEQFVNDQYGTSAAFAIAESSDGQIWLGSKGRIDILSPDNFAQSVDNIKTDGHTFTLKQLGKNLWLAGIDRGLVKIERHNGKFVLEPVYQSTALAVIKIIKFGQSLYLAAHNGIYFVRDLNHWQNPAEKLTTADLDKAKFNPDVFYYDGLIDQQQRLWFAGRQGVVVLVDPKDNYLVPKTSVVNGQGLETTITSFSQVDDNTLLMGSYNGMYQYDMRTNRATTVTSVSELYQICNVLSHESGVWLTTGDVIVELDKKSLEIKRFLGQQQGITDGQCTILSRLLTSGQCLVFGSLKGVSRFCPDRLPTIIDQKAKPILFTALEINYQQNLPLGEYRQYSDKPVLTTERLLLDHQVKQLALDFTAVDFNGNGLSYAYKMDNLMDDWVETKRKKIAFTTLPSGEYRLKVKAFHELQPLNTSTAELLIVKKPPWWLSPWAYGIYGGFMLLSYFIVYRLRVLRNEREALRLKGLVHKKTAELVEKNNEILEQKQALEKASLCQEQLLEQKNTMLSAISHEMKTPLTVLKGALQQLQDFPKKKSLAMALLDNNFARLSAFVDQILLVSKLKKLQGLQTQPVPLTSVVKTVVSYLQPVAMRYDQTVQLDIQDEIELHGNAPGLELAVNNIIKNAIVHAGSGRLIEVKLELVEQNSGNVVVLSVTDNGVGMDETTRLSMFKAFVSGSDEPGSIHSGLGLALCQEIVNVHQGEIKVQSRPGQGTCVTVELPNGQRVKGPQDYTSTLPKFVLSTPLENDIDKTKPLLLIADDEPDILVLLSLQLGEEYRLILADSGQKALELITNQAKQLPDMVIVDRYMPDTSGIEVLRQVRLMEQTKFIPVIMFSADTSDENQIQGLREGTDLFVTKPFDYHLLKANINRLLEKVAFANKEAAVESQLHDEQLAQSPSNAQLKVDRDKAFLTQLSDVVQLHYQDPEFTVKCLAAQFNMSEVTFRSKVQQMTGSLPKHYLFNFRSEKAKLRLNLESDLSIKDIAEAYGFKDEAQMRRWFKEFYGRTPSQMR